MRPVCNLYICPALFLWLTGAGSATPQEEPLSQIVNGGFEEVAEESPTGWRLAAPSGGAELTLDAEEAFEGRQSAKVNTLEVNAPSGGMAANLVQSIDGKPWRGKRVRYRAAVKTAQLEASGGAQLWFRVDRKSEGDRPALGGFDNMQDRPIRGEAWEHHDIVVQIDDDAERLVFGMFVRGQGEVWLDDVTLTEVDPQTPQTGRPIGTDESSASRAKSESEKDDQPSQPASRFQISPIVMKAMSEAEGAPQQPFFTPWMGLALVALILFGLAGLPPKGQETTSPQGERVAKMAPGPIRRFAVRFSVAYWLLYCLPSPFQTLTSRMGSAVGGFFQPVMTWYSSLNTAVVGWTARNLFGISGELVPPNGSGDTTFNYIQVFVYFVLALLIAGIWSAIDRRRTDYRNIRDLLASYLRYVLAITMLSYGLAKLGWDSNQFPPLEGNRLDRTWGESSPMGVLWSFMGASRPYTFFAGLGEVIGGSLLLFRRTALLGCFVVLGVMINVMMLNYCYDVPVKLYSTHLVCMSLFLLLPEMGRLGSLFFLNKPVQPATFRPPYLSERTAWGHWVIKLALIVLVLGVPVYQHVGRQIQYFAEQSRSPEFFGDFDVASVKLNGEGVESPSADVEIWETVKFERLAYNQKMARVPSNWITLASGNKRIATTFSVNGNELSLADPGNPSIPFEVLELTGEGPDGYILRGESDAGRVELSLERKTGQKYRLTGRGFRWINEVPFNR